MTKFGTASASVGGTVIASTLEWEEADGDIYFPPESLRQQYFTQTEHHTKCPHKGEASYFDVAVESLEPLESLESPKSVKSLSNAAWFYPAPLEEAYGVIKGHVAFYKGMVDIQAREE